MIPLISNRASHFARRLVLLSGISVWWLLWSNSDVAVAATDYTIDVRDTDDGLPSSTVTTIAQTPDGYLWVGTFNGLARYDGERFVTFTAGGGLETINRRIRGLYTDVEGTLWINTYDGGLVSYRNGIFENEWKGTTQPFNLDVTLAASSSNRVAFVLPLGDVLQRSKEPSGKITWQSISPPGGVHALFQCADSTGRLWFLTSDGKILWCENGNFKYFDGFRTISADARVSVIAAGANGHMWIGGENFIGEWNGEGVTDMTPTNGEALFSPKMILPASDDGLWVLVGDELRKQMGRQWTTEVQEWRGRLDSAPGRSMGAHLDRNGGIWFNHYGNGVFHISPDGKCERLTTANGLPGDRVGAWFQSRDGSIWLGVDYGGLVQLRERHFQIIGQAEGLPVRTALSVCEDPQGKVWVGTGGGGLCQWDNDNLMHFPIGRTISANFVFSICPRPDGGLWFSAAGREDLYTFHDDKIQRGPDDVHGVKALLTDRTGRVWVGTTSGLFWFSGVHRHVFTTNDGVGISTMRALAEAPDGAIWSGADDGTLYRCTPERVESFRPSDPLARQPIRSLLADADGTVWAGTIRGGVLRFQNGTFSRTGPKQGLPAGTISQILADTHDRLWFGTSQGIFYIAKSTLNSCADGKINHVDCGRLNGLPSLECSDGYQPSCWRGADGRLWFTTVDGVVSVKPEQPATSSVRAPVLVDELLVDGEPMHLNGVAVKISPGGRHYQFHYTALNFETTRFRYKLEGYDQDWIEAGTKRTAQYSSLPAGHYQFRVIACDDNGLWNQTGAVLAITVQPYFYAQPWFIVLMSLLALGTVALVVRNAATRKYRKELAWLEKQHAIEQDRARIAKDIHDDIGAGLTQIKLLSELARHEKDRAAVHLDRISDSARGMTRAMDEIVWAANPRHDTFSGLADYLSVYVEDFLRMAGIRCRMDIPTALPDRRIDGAVRYNLFLALKETLNNVVKHAQATEVHLRLEIGRDAFSLIVEDNGKGLNGMSGVSNSGGDRIASGSGLANLKKRMSSVGGCCKIESQPERGTRVELTIPAGATASGTVF